MPDHGIIGAGVALLVSYAVVVALMHAITRRLFYVPYEWGRLALAVGLAAGLIAIGELAVPHDGLGGLALTLALCAAYPVGLYVAAVPERGGARAPRRALRPRPPRPPGAPTATSTRSSRPSATRTGAAQRVGARAIGRG